MSLVKGYTLKEVAKAAGCAAPTVIKWVKDGKVKVTLRKNRSRHYVFTEAEKRKIVAYANRLKPVR